MVTFVCHHCDATLKKSQLEKHSFGRCRPSAFICIDCHVTFHGLDYKAHVSCLTEFEKHWGYYAKPKQISKKDTPVPLETDNNIQKQDSKKEVNDSPTQYTLYWRGWKNELKSLLKQHNKSLPLYELKELAFKRYNSISHEYALDPTEMYHMFYDKLHKLKKVKVVSYIVLY